jgi:hypothetical protein
MNGTGIALAALALIGLPAVAEAQATAIATWVSSTGVDTGNCNLAAPCRTFQYAHDHTAAGGEIDVKDAGRFGALSITKSISIVAAGFQAGMSVAANTIGIAVNAGTTDTVIIRGLTIDGHGLGYDGISATQAGLLVIRDCVIQGMTGAGIRLVSATILPKVGIVNVVAQHNAYGVYKTGTYLSGAAADARIVSLSIAGSAITGNATGLYLRGDDTLVDASSVEYNSTYGIDDQGSITLGASVFNGNAGNMIAKLKDDPNYSYGDNKIRDAGFPILNTLSPK